MRGVAYSCISACVNLPALIESAVRTCIYKSNELELVALLDEQDTLDADSGIGVADIVGGLEVLYEQRKHRQQLLLRELCPEGV